MDMNIQTIMRADAGGRRSIYPSVYLSIHPSVCLYIYMMVIFLVNYIVFNNLALNYLKIIHFHRKAIKL